MTDQPPTPDPTPRCTCGGELREQCCEPDCARWDEAREAEERPKNDDENDHVL